jgi:hypothetical protein
MRKFNAYSDRRAPDGIIATGWRKVKKDGKVKFGGSYYSSPELSDIAGELVQVVMGEYWQSYVQIYRGRIGCLQFFCNATAFA